MKPQVSVQQIQTATKICQKLATNANADNPVFLFNPLMKDVIILRYKQVYVTEDGGVGSDIFYTGIYSSGNTFDFANKYGDQLYLVLKDFTPFVMDINKITLS